MLIPEENAASSPPQNASFGAAFKAILCAFIGIRKSGDPANGAVRLNPLHVVIAALIGAALFITLLLCVVKAVVPR